jgi:hypothetical protein
LIQNALDEPGVTQINVTLTPVRGQALADLRVEDDSPGRQDVLTVPHFLRHTLSPVPKYTLATVS